MSGDYLLNLYFKSRNSILEGRHSKGALYLSDNIEDIRNECFDLDLPTMFSICNALPSEFQLATLSKQQKWRKNNEFYYCKLVDHNNKAILFIYISVHDYKGRFKLMYGPVAQEMFNFKQMEGEKIYQSTAMSQYKEEEDVYSDYSKNQFNYHPIAQLFVRKLDSLGKMQPVMVPIIEQCRSKTKQRTMDFPKYPFDKYFSNLDGYKFVCYSENTEEYPLKYLGKCVQMLAWIPKYTKYFIENEIINFNELDATFKSCKPYTGITFTGVVHNTGVPLIYVLAPSESKEALDYGYACLLKFAEIEMITKPVLSKFVLSDRGSAITSFLEEHQIHHFFCYRHLIEQYGSKSKYTPIIYYLYSQTTREKYDEAVKIALIHLERMPKDDKYESFINLIENGDSWALYARLIGENGHDILAIASCSNHIESEHRVMNKHSEEHNKLEFRLISVLETLKQRFDYFFKDPFRNAKSKIYQLVQIAQTKGINGTTRCNCFARRYNTCLYGIPDFPCRHIIQQTRFYTEKRENGTKYHLNQINTYDKEQATLINGSLLIEETTDNHIPMPKPRQNRRSDTQATYLEEEEMAFAAEIVEANDQQKMKKFIKFTVYMVMQMINVSKESAYLIIATQLLEYGYRCTNFDDNQYFDLSLKLVMGCKAFATEFMTLDELKKRYMRYIEETQEKSVDPTKNDERSTYEFDDLVDVTGYDYDIHPTNKMPLEKKGPLIRLVISRSKP